VSEREKWRPFFRREDTPEQIDRNIDAEFDAHLELRIEQLKAEGLSEEEARIRAMALLGDAGRAARLCERTDRTWLWRDRAGSRIGSIVSDIRHALRLFRTSPLFTGMAALCLAVGITFISVTSSLVDGTLFDPLPFKDADELVMVGQVTARLADWTWLRTSYPDFREWETRNHVFEHLALASWRAYTITDLDDPVRVAGSEVTDALDEVLGVTPILGRTFAPEDYFPEAEPVVLIGYKIWQSAFGGDPAVIGRWITIDGSLRYRIVGVMPNYFTFPDSRQLWMPFRPRTPAPRLYWYVTVGRLRDGVSLDAAGTEMRQIGARLAEEFPETAERGEVRVVSLGSFLFRSLRTPLLIIFVAACLVLLLACSNLANLMLSRATGRNRELSVRAALGAGRGRLIQQVMIESLVIALAGGAIGIVLGRLGLNLLLANVFVGLPGFIQFGLNPRILAVLGGTVVLSGVIFGLAPSLSVRRRALGILLRDDAVRMSSGKKHALAQSALVTFQIMLATIILGVTGLVVRSYLESRTHRLGVDTDLLLGQYLELPPWTYAGPENWIEFYRTAQERLRNRPEIEAAAFVSEPPAGRSDRTMEICTPGTALDSEQLPLLSRARIVSPGYFATTGIPLLAGRDFTDADMREGSRITIISESLARILSPDGNPLGRSFFLSHDPDPEQTVEVVGVAGDVRYGGPGTEAGPCFYLPLNPSTARRDGWLVMRSAVDPQALIPAVREDIRSIDPRMALMTPVTIAGLAQEKYWPTILASWILAIIAAFALILAVIGVVGIVVYSIMNRRREFGIRMALGASTGEIIRGVVSKGAVMGGIGISVGTMVTAASTRFLTGITTGTDVHDPVIYAFVITFLITTTLLACYLPARRIARIDPVEVLREE
jgi:putative ABC transport system permease protein